MTPTKKRKSISNDDPAHVTIGCCTWKLLCDLALVGSATADAALAECILTANRYRRDESPGRRARVAPDMFDKARAIIEAFRVKAYGPTGGPFHQWGAPNGDHAAKP